MDARVKPAHDELTIDDIARCRLGMEKAVLDMTRERILFLILGALVVAVVVLGYQLQQERKKTSGIDINIGEKGISIEKK